MNCPNFSFIIAQKICNFIKINQNQGSKDSEHDFDMNPGVLHLWTIEHIMLSHLNIYKLQAVVLICLVM